MRLYGANALVLRQAHPAAGELSDVSFRHQNVRTLSAKSGQS
jgi:hypothetical protein